MDGVQRRDGMRRGKQEGRGDGGERGLYTRPPTGRLILGGAKEAEFQYGQG